jgi:hypothetical protein
MWNFSKKTAKSVRLTRKWPPGNLKAGICPVLIQRRTVELLTPHRLAIKPTETYSGVHCSAAFVKILSWLDTLQTDVPVIIFG